MPDVLKETNAYTSPSFTLKNRLRRAVWNLFYVLLFRFSPRLFHSWRNFLLRTFGAKIGKGCHVYPRAKVWAPWNLIMEDYSCLADDVVCDSMDKVHIGKKVVVSQGTHIVTGSHDYTDPKFRLFTRPVAIGSHAWIAAEVFICPGVRIGEGAVVGARSVVTRDIPAWRVCAGDPCKPLKEREIKGKDKFKG